MAGEIRDIFPLVACTSAMQDGAGISLWMSTGVRVAGEGRRCPKGLLLEPRWRFVLQRASSTEGRLVVSPCCRGEAMLARRIPL